LLAGATLAVFWPATRFDFINVDDPVYFSDNPHILGELKWRNVVWALCAGLGGNWHPVTWLSFMLDATLFGPGPRGPHLVNLLLHTANGLLVFLLLRRMTQGRQKEECRLQNEGAVWRSAVVAALFALHPLRVESVAWVAERKDVLSGFFFMLTLWAYVSYVRTAESRPVLRSPSSVALRRLDSTAEGGKQKAETGGGLLRSVLCPLVATGFPSSFSSWA
jgi:hypothetical protein